MSAANVRASGMAPLRKIVDRRAGVLGKHIEVLECGHEQRQKSDIYGPTNAYRRRCRQCRAAGVYR